MNKNIFEANRWLAQAEFDLKAAEVLSSKGFYENACFLTHQTAEKALKALLYYKGERELIGHSTIILAKKISKYFAVTKEIFNTCRELDKFYIPTRYPDALPASTPHEFYSQEDAENAIKLAKNVLNFIKAKIK